MGQRNLFTNASIRSVSKVSIVGLNHSVGVKAEITIMVRALVALPVYPVGHCSFF